MQSGWHIQQTTVLCSVKGFFDIQEYRSRINIIIFVYGHVIYKIHAHNYRAVKCTKAKLTWIQQVLFFNVPFYCFYNNFLLE
jgi:hypothetical protein